MRKILLFAALCVLIVSCKQDEIPHADNSLAPLVVSSTSFLTVAPKAATLKSTTLPPDLSKIGVYLLSDLPSGYNQLNNVEYDYSTSTAKWSPAVTNTQNIYLNNNQATVCAYYPLGAAGINALTDPKNIALTSQLYSTAQDLCFAPKQKSPTNSSPGVAFNMIRAYAEITFTFTKDATYTGVGLINNISISNAAILTTNSLDMTIGAYGTIASPPGTVSYNPGITSITSGTPVTSTILMVPVSSLSGDMTFSFTVDGKTMTASLPVSSNHLNTLTAGTNYTANVTFKGTILDVTSVTITDWVSQNVDTPMTIN